MLPSTVTVNVLFIFTILSLSSEVCSQTTTDDFHLSNRYRSCSASSYCTPIRKCSSLRDGWKRRGVGITCGHGSGPYRRVCCPRVHREEVPARITSRLVTYNPASPSYSKSSRDCGASQGIDWFQEHVVDDEDVAEATWPWMAAIKGQNASGIPYFRCSGLLIDKTHVLTVAHCFVYGNDDERFTVHIGSDDHDLAKEYPVSEIKVHEKYEKDFYDNIALLTLATEVDLPNFVPICLPDEGIEAKDLTGWGTTLVGWGSEDPSEPASSALKQLDNIPIVSNQECNEVFDEIFPSYRKQFPRGISREILCSGKTEGSRDACSAQNKRKGRCEKF